MIDEDRTLQLYGYTSDMLKPRSSKKPIVKVCDECGKYSITTKNIYQPLCKSCAAIKRWKLPKIKFVLEQDRFIPNTQIDRILTIKKFGYDPINLKLKSGRKVIRICKTCGEIKEIYYWAYSNLCQNCLLKQEETRIIHSCTLQGITRDEFDGFLTDQRYCKLFNNKFKEKIRNKFHNKCYLCGKEQGNRKLSVHHVNYNKNCLCGQLCEFIPLCQGCHVKTNYNRQIWENLIMSYLYPNRYFMAEI